MKIFSYATQSNQEILDTLATTLESGLPRTVAQARQLQYGKNAVETIKVEWWRTLLAQLMSPLMYLLLFSAFLSYLLGESGNSVTILVMISINAFMGFRQEFKAETAVQLLNKYLVSWSTVRRDGRELTLKSDDLVPGDIVIVQPGDIIPADIRFLYEYNLMVNESALSGEAIPARKTSKVLEHAVQHVHQAQNLGFAGTTVESGKGVGVVVAIGEGTSLGAIAQIVRDTEQVSGFNQAIAAFCSFIIKMMVVAVSLTFIIHFIAHRGTMTLAEIGMFSIAMAVSAIPEILPIITTILLSRSALKLARQSVVVKRLSAIEDLGNIEILCTDKTGTLTENHLTVAGVFGVDPANVLKHALWCAAPTSSKATGLRTAYDEALINYFSDQKELSLNHYQPIHEIPFTPERRRSGAVIQVDNRYEYVVRGATEAIIGSCESATVNLQAVQEWIACEEKLGHRVLAIAKKSVEQLSDQVAQIDSGFEFLGLIAFNDPIKRSAFSALEKAQELGVAIKIITGDSARVAGAVAYKMGLVKDVAAVVTGDMLEQADEAEQLRLIEAYDVFARIAPVQKLRIIQLLRRKFRVGFLGEGINDAPALRIASVGIVVDNATDVAKSAADIVLLQKSLRAIVNGISEGRAVFANTVKYIRTKLASNISNFSTITFAAIFLDFLPMLPIQIILLDLFSDLGMMAIATDTVEANELQRPQGYTVRGIVSFIIVLGLTSSLFDFLMFWVFAGQAHAVIQTNWFIFSYFTQVLFFISVRTKVFVLKAQPVSRSWLSIVACTGCGVLILPFTTVGVETFKFVPPTAWNLACLLIILVFFFITIEAVKLLFYRQLEEKGS